MCESAKNIAGKLKTAPTSKTMIASGGAGVTGNPCEAFHYHGLVGMESEAVDLIAAWTLKTTE